MAWQSSTINPATTTPAADISKITNDLQQLRGVIGGTPDAQIPSVWATAANVLAQTANSGTTAGTNTAYTLTPATAIASYAAGQTFWVTFHTASGANPTLQISGVASPPTLVRQAADGTYVNIGAGDIPANHRSRVTLLSTSQALVEEMPPRIASGLKNKIINGKMEIAQRGTSFAAIADSAYSLDRWKHEYVTTGVTTASQQADVPNGNEFQNSLRIAVTTADTSIAAGDTYIVTHTIEGFNARDLIGRTFTLSFWARSSKTGTHCVAFVNNNSDRSYVAEYTVNAANAWEFKTVTVPGGLITAGTWNWTNGAGLKVRFALAVGSTFQTTAGAWQTGNFSATSNQVNCLDSTSNIFAITGVQLEVGSFATEFDHRPFSAELALCQRYFCKTFDNGTAPGQNLGTNGSINFVSQAAQIWDAMWRFPVEMRVTPTTVTTFSTNAASANWSTNVDTPTASVSVIGTAGLSIRASTPGAAGRAYFIHATASAEL